MQKFANIWAFYKSTFVVNVALSIAGAALGGIATFAICFLSIGFISAIAIKEINAKSEYVFYRNNGLTRQQLWGFGYAANTFVFFAALLIFALCRSMF